MVIQEQWKTIGKTTFCHLVISSGCSMGTPKSLDSSGKPLENVGETVHLQCASQVSGNGVPGFAKNLTVAQKHWKSLWKSSFRALAPAEFKLILDFIIHQPHALPPKWNLAGRPAGGGFPYITWEKFALPGPLTLKSCHSFTIVKTLKILGKSTFLEKAWQETSYDLYAARLS